MRDSTHLRRRSWRVGGPNLLALSVLELDPETPGLICMEEPENGIHPDRIPSILRLLQDIATAPNEAADETNPLRQVIVNTHSPPVVMAVPDGSILLARPTKDIRDGQEFTRVEFACLQDNWRTKATEKPPIVSKGEIGNYLNPAAAVLAEGRSQLRKHIQENNWEPKLYS